jgi:ABC-type transporter Mla subunit MlaD
MRWGHDPDDRRRPIDLGCLLLVVLAAVVVLVVWALAGVVPLPGR